MLLILAKKYLILFFFITSFITAAQASYHNYPELVTTFEQEYKLRESAPKPFPAKPFLDKQRLDELITMAIEIEDLYPNDTHIIYGLGNSPALLIATLQFLNKDFIDTYKSIAFSKGKELFELSSSEQKTFEINKKYLYNYFNLIGINPFTLESTNKTIVITDVIASGKGFQAFTALLEEYFCQTLGKEKGIQILKEKFIFHLFKIGYVPSLDMKNNYIPTWAKTNTCQKTAPEILIRSADISEFRRLIPCFSYDQWQTINPLKFKPEPKALALVKKVRDYIKELSE